MSLLHTFLFYKLYFSFIKVQVGFSQNESRQNGISNNFVPILLPVCNKQPCFHYGLLSAVFSAKRESSLEAKKQYYKMK